MRIEEILMKVLSLFDGMSCGMLAMKSAGIDMTSKENRYVAYEIDKNAIKVSEHNFPMIEHKGDVFKADFTEYKGFDFVIGGSPCFTAGHMVLTDKGYKPIEEIEIGDMVLTHKNRFRKVLATGNKVAPVRRLKVGSCLELTGTETHPFPTRDQYSAYKPSTGGMVKALTDVNRVELKDLVPDKSHLGINCLQTSEDIPELTDEELWYYGRYIADGHCQIYKRKHRRNSYQYAVILSIGSDKLNDFFAHTPNMTYTSYYHTQSVYRVCIYSKEMCERIEEFGFGRYADEKVIPMKFLNLPAERLKILLEGYFSGDGCKIRNGMTCTTISKELALSLQMAVLKVYGVNANITMPKIAPTKVLEGRTINQRPQYVVTFHYTSSCATRSRLVENQMWFPVTSVSEIIGEETVYNMTVDEDHSYTVNNVCAFNCTFWSIAQQPEKRETEAHGMGWDLFQQYVRAIKEAEPKYFIYENNKSMAPAIRESISGAFGFEPICINSALVSAQNRQRLYWVGIRNEDGTYRKADIGQPEDRGILLKDILESGCDHMVGNNVDKKTCVAEPVSVSLQVVGEKKRNADGEWERSYIARTDGKASTLTFAENRRMVAEPICHVIPQEVSVRKYSCDLDELKKLLRNNKNKTNKEIAEALGKPITMVEHWFRSDKSFSVPDADIWFDLKALLGITTTEFDDYVTVFETKEGTFDKNNRCYDTNGKMSTLMTGKSDNIIEPVAEPVAIASRTRDNDDGSRSKRFEAGGNKANCLTTTRADSMVAEPVEVRGMNYELAEVYDKDEGVVARLDMPKCHDILTRVYGVKGKSPTITAMGGGNVEPKVFSNVDTVKSKTETPIYEVKDGKITIKGRQYPIKLADGFYIIRKLTVTECKRLQTVPDDYDMSVISNTQAYRCLGNGWTVEVIAHLIKGALKD